MKKIFNLVFLLVVLAVLAVGYRQMEGYRESAANAMRAAETAMRVAEARQEEFIGYKKYADYLSAGKMELSAQSKFICASVSREYVMAEHVKRDMKIFSSDGFFTLRYRVDYPIGVDLSLAAFDVKATDRGVELSVKRPTLVAKPGITPGKHEIVNSGMLTDEKTALVELMKRLPGLAEEQGRSLASQPEIQALCEKSLINFLQTFLAKQPGVKMVPAITVTYR